MFTGRHKAAAMGIGLAVSLIIFGAAFRKGVG